MWKRPRGNQAAAFKARITAAGVRNERRLAKLAKGFDVHAGEITAWKDQVISGVASVFGGRPVRPPVDVMSVRAKIGELALENHFLGHALGKAGLLSANR